MHAFQEGSCLDYSGSEAYNGITLCKTLDVYLAVHRKHSTIYLLLQSNEV